MWLCGQSEGKAVRVRAGRLGAEAQAHGAGAPVSWIPQPHRCKEWPVTRRLGQGGRGTAVGKSYELCFGRRSSARPPPPPGDVFPY